MMLDRAFWRLHCGNMVPINMPLLRHVFRAVRETMPISLFLRHDNIVPCASSAPGTFGIWVGGRVASFEYLTDSKGAGYD
jgi:hypothetical protein